MPDAGPFSEFLQGRHALVTGGGTGIGKALALALDEAGANVSILGRREQPLVETSAQFKNDGGYAVADVTCEADIKSAIAARIAAAGPVSILINNAGAADTAPFAKTSNEMWDKMIAVNMTAAFMVTREIVPQMGKNEFGRIINIASTASLKGYAYVSAYVAAKHGLLGMTRALALELAASKITVNALCPGFTDTGLVERSIETIVEKTGMDAAAARGQLTATNPQGRLVTPHEVANAAIWLCTEGAASVTGQAITLAGGEIM